MYVMVFMVCACIILNPSPRWRLFYYRLVIYGALDYLIRHSIEIKKELWIKYKVECNPFRCVFQTGRLCGHNLIVHLLLVEDTQLLNMKQ